MNKKITWYAAGIIAVASMIAVSSSWNDSIIVDEVPHIGAGYSYLEKNDMRLNPEHPPLAKDVAAIPLTFMNLKQDAFSTKFWLTDINGQWEFGRYFLFNSGNDADIIRHWVKGFMIIFFVLSAIIVFKWSRRLFGETGALIALTLFSFSPTIMAHSRFVTTDMPALFGVLAATYFFIKYLRQPSVNNMVIAGLVFGISLLLKFNTFLLVPFLGLLSLIHGYIQSGLTFNERLMSAIKAGIISVFIFAIGFIFVVWPVYYFHTANYPVERQQNDTRILLSSYGNRLFADPVVWMSDKPVIRAAGQYFLGLLMVVQRSTGGNTTYFLGQTSGTGWHYYFPVVYFLKEPLAWWGLVLIALASIAAKFKGFIQSLRVKNWFQDHFEEFAMLLWLGIYWTSSITSNLNIGVRHLLPTFPFAIMLVSGRVSGIISTIKTKIQNINPKYKTVYYVFNSLLFVLLGWLIVENIRIYPYYLSYFNQVAGGPGGGYRYVVDSNLDWGQDLIRLNDWVRKNNISKIELDYFGWADPYYYLRDKYIWLNSTKYTNADDFRLRNKSNGWLAVSATFLEGSEGTPDKPNPINYKNWLQAIKPEVVIGNSIFVYRIR